MKECIFLIKYDSKRDLITSIVLCLGRSLGYDHSICTVVEVKTLCWFKSILDRAGVSNEDQFCYSNVRTKGPTKNEERVRG